MDKQTKNYLITFVFAVVVIGGITIFQSGKEREQPVKQDVSLTKVQNIGHAHGLAVDVKDSNALYIATHHGLLVFKNEKDLYRIGSRTDDYMGFSPHPTDSQIFFSSGHPVGGGNIGFQKSEDGGFTWKKVANGFNGPVDFHAMTVSMANPNIMYGWYKGALQRSDDGGNTWVIVNMNVFAVSLATDPKNENIVYLGTPDGRGILMSEDKGVTWGSVSKELEGGQVAVVAVDPNSPDRLFTFAEKIGGLGVSDDRGKTWRHIKESFGSETVLYIAFDRNNVGTIYALTHMNNLYKSVDSGLTWHTVVIVS